MPNTAPLASSREHHPTAAPLDGRGPGTAADGAARSRARVSGLALAMASAATLVCVLGLVLDGGGEGKATDRPAASAPGPTAAALQEIPAAMLDRYRRAARSCPGLPWAVLAGIGRVETDHGRLSYVSPKGAVGPMQFLPETFEIFGVDGDGNGSRNVHDPDDAVESAARYLCRHGGSDPRRLRDAIWDYNHSDAYVDAVLGHARRYGPVPEVALITPRGSG